VPFLPYDERSAKSPPFWANYSGKLELYPRFVVSALLGLIGSGFAWSYSSPRDTMVGALAFSIAFALPSIQGKKMPLFAFLVFLPTFFGLAMMHVFGEVRLFRGASCMAVFAVAGSSAGLLEGWWDGSLATLEAGLTGGMVSGSAAGAVCAKMLPSKSLGDWGPKGETAVIALAAAMVMVHVGVVLSVFVGRWARDLPRRRRGSIDTDNYGPAGPDDGSAP